MTNSNTLPNYDTWKLATPPYLDGYASEPCDRCHRDLDDSATLVRMSGNYFGYYCSDCASPVDRCDQCHYVRCTCEDDR